MAFGHDSASAQWFESREAAEAHRPSDDVNWGFKNRPAPTVTGGGGKASGIEIFDQQSRWKLVAQIDAGVTMNGRIMACGCEWANHDIDRCEAASSNGIVPMREKHWRDDIETAQVGIDELNAADLATVIHGNGRPTNPNTKLDPIRLLPEEAAALQSYPKDFEFKGSKGKQFMQIGNAVPVLLAQHILEALWADDEVEMEKAA